MTERLFPALGIPAVGAAGPGYASEVNARLDEINERADAIVIPAVVGGVVDNTSMIEDYLGAAPPGSSVRFSEPGPVGCKAIPPIQVPVRLYGAGGPWGTRLVVLEDTADPIIDFDIPPAGSIWDRYGAGVTRLGIDMSYAPNSTGVRTGADSTWMILRDLIILGAPGAGGNTIGIDNRGINNRIEGCQLYDHTRHIVVDTDTGAQLNITDVGCYRNSLGVTEVAIDMSGQGLGGSVYMHNVTVGSYYDVDRHTLKGVRLAATDAYASSPLFMTQCYLDNITDGGSGFGEVVAMDLVNVSDIQVANSWFNAGSSMGGAPVRIEGGKRLQFMGNKLIGKDRAYDFVGGNTQELVSVGNFCPAGPTYRLPVSGKPTDLLLDDLIPGATVLSQVTNDIDGLRAACARRWGAVNLMDRLSLAEVPWAGTPFLNIGTLGEEGIPGQVTIPAPDVDAFFSQFVLFRFSPAGTLGASLEIAAKDATAQTMTIQSRKPDGTIQTADTSIVGYLRFDLPH